MRALVAAVLMGLLAGCGSVASHLPAATSQPSSIAGASPSPSPTPSQSPTASPSLAGQAPSCRLPVRWAAQDGFKGGFLSFPDQVLTVDPTASLFYDRAFAKWLPAVRTQVSPDGRRYASGGEPKLISSEILDPAVGGGAAWGLHLNAADPSPGPGGVEGPVNEVLRFDLC